VPGCPHCPHCHPHGLTRVKLRVLRRLAEGQDTAEIARHLRITRQAVKNHLSGIYRVLGVSCAVEAILEAERRGIVAFPDALPGVITLPPFERWMLGQMATGRTYREIARRCGKSESTVKNYGQCVLKALGVHSRCAAVVLGRRYGYL